MAAGWTRGSSRAPATCRRRLYAAHAFLHEPLKILRHDGVGTQKGWGRGVMFIGDLTSNYRELTGRLVTASPESQLPASGDTEMWREDEGCHTPPTLGSKHLLRAGLERAVKQAGAKQ
ncbi:hypothetical protein GWK47_031949 [Chionoecetes opilio]|uniref:Uncharacterized protein n=1 Tax=Chionoecetes opilio TaxID=41210 RepID=A0A8J4YJR5_CHIOP|nr:hypothetical protein GWK47_031949 [Chionoecetes opilio]